MERKLHFVLLFAAFALNFHPIFAKATFEFGGSNVIISDTCDAPAPDSFRITSVSSNSIALAWEPIWMGAEHSLIIHKKNPTGAWETFLSRFTVQGVSYTAINLTPGSEYRFIIATNCGPDEPSSIKINIDGIALILELTIAGRNPTNPVPVDCHKIKYLEHEWVGFKVETYTKQGELISSLFEVEAYGGDDSKGFISHGIIKRVDYENPIVATNDSGKWPTNQQSSLFGSNPFRMGHKKNDGIGTIPIGRVGLTGYPASIDLCADYNNTEDPWRQNYLFTAMTAETVSGFLPSAFDERSESPTNQQVDAWAQSPFNEHLDVFIPLADQRHGNGKIYLLNAAGLIIMDQKVNAQCSIISFQTGSLVAGLYFIRIESGRKVQTLKTIKIL